MIVLPMIRAGPRFASFPKLCVGTAALSLCGDDAD
jgi:hypothetical protein